MKHLSFLAVVIGLCTSSLVGAQTGLREIPMAEVQAAFDRPLPQHPRLLMTDAQLAETQARLKSNPSLQVFYRAVLEKADTIISQKPVRRIQTGRRLLSVSRTCLDRVLHLSTAYRFSHRPAYRERAEQEMLAAAGFSDWNPSHFLDVAEMTAALALGYDWLYPDLPETSRATMRQAILEKGIRPSLKNAGWVRGHNNWNQVCYRHQNEMGERRCAVYLVVDPLVGDLEALDHHILCRRSVRIPDAIGFDVLAVKQGPGSVDGSKADAWRGDEEFLAVSAAANEDGVAGLRGPQGPLDRPPRPHLVALIHSLGAIIVVIGPVLLDRHVEPARLSGRTALRVRRVDDSRRQASQRQTLLLPPPSLGETETLSRPGSRWNSAIFSWMTCWTNCGLEKHNFSRSAGRRPGVREPLRCSANHWGCSAPKRFHQPPQAWTADSA